jgi:anti-sigma regulatory factor (Ser/Thr protein kinase)
MLTHLDISAITNRAFPEYQRDVFRIIYDLRGHSEKADMFVVAVGEVIANSNSNGKPPWGIRVYSDNGVLIVRISDHGTGPRKLNGKMPTVHNEGGRGIPIVRACSTVCLWGWENGESICRLELPP